MIALVTGANRGIGRHIALGLAARGWTIAALGRNKPGVEAVAEECRDVTGEGMAVVADVVDGDAVRAAVARVLDKHGGIDLLVNNAATIESVEAEFGEVDIDETWRVVEVGVRGSMNVTHAVLPRMLERGVGRIVNINSGSAYRKQNLYAGYGVAKAALAQLTTRVDSTYRDRGVRAFDVAPGVVKTDMTTSMPMHDTRTNWTEPERVVDFIADIGAGKLDELSGRFFRAGADTVESLMAQKDAIISRDARVLRLYPIDDSDPLA